MIPENLQEAERDFRRSVVRYDYRDLPRRLADLRTIAGEYLASLSANDPARRELLSWGIALTEWGRKMISTQRQRWADEKQPLSLIGGYRQGSGSHVSRVCIDL